MEEGKMLMTEADSPPPPRIHDKPRCSDRPIYGQKFANPRRSGGKAPIVKPINVPGGKASIDATTESEKRTHGATATGASLEPNKTEGANLMDANTAGSDPQAAATETATGAPSPAGEPSSGHATMREWQSAMHDWRSSTQIALRPPQPQAPFDQ